MANIVPKPVPCETCGGTGRCPTCGGSGELADGELCLDCAGGLCLICIGTGKELEFEVDGRVAERVGASWTTLLVTLPVLLLVGISYALVESGGGPPPAWLLALDFAGLGFVGLWMFRARLHQRRMDRTEENFYAEAHAAMEAAEEALDERRRRRGLE